MHDKSFGMKGLKNLIGDMQDKFVSHIFEGENEVFFPLV